MTDKPPETPAPAPQRRRLYYRWDAATLWTVELHLWKRGAWTRTASAHCTSRGEANACADKWHQRYPKLEDVYDDSWVARSIVLDISEHTKGT